MALSVCILEKLARASLGYKSLQNEFFYLKKGVIESFGIEPRYLSPIYRMSDLQPDKYLQSGRPRQNLFLCTEREADLRGTGALKYIRGMGSKPATMRKQKRGTQTIRAALEAQAGGRWYSPKAKPNASHIWLRKAFGSVFAPFVFEKAVVVDQRCNFLVPKDGLEWAELAALVSSTVFALALESQGSATMGAGALEVPTKGLRLMRVIDVRALSASERGELAQLGRAVWERERPIDWARETEPGPALQELDSWLLKRRGASVPLAKLYADVRETCRGRLRLASDKAVNAKKVSRRDLGEVARGIAESVRPLLEGKGFPEAFIPNGSATTRVELGRENSIAVEAAAMLGNTHVTVRAGETDLVALSGDYTRGVAQVLVAALLLGRRTFQLPLDEEIASVAIDDLIGWRRGFAERIDDECRKSSLGTRFEDGIRRAVYHQLGVAPEIATEREFTGRFTIEAVRQANASPDGD